MTGQKKPSLKKVQNDICDIFERGNIVTTLHIKERMQARNFSMQDIMHVIEHGRLKQNFLWNEKCSQWNFDIKGLAIDGEPLTVRLAIEKNKLILITGF